MLWRLREAAAEATLDGRPGRNRADGIRLRGNARAAGTARAAVAAGDPLGEDRGAGHRRDARRPRVRRGATSRRARERMSPLSRNARRRLALYGTAALVVAGVWALPIVLARLRPPLKFRRFDVEAAAAMDTARGEAPPRGRAHRHVEPAGHHPTGHRRVRARARVRRDPDGRDRGRSASGPFSSRASRAGAAARRSPSSRTRTSSRPETPRPGRNPRSPASAGRGGTPPI